MSEHEGYTTKQLLEWNDMRGEIESLKKQLSERLKYERGYHSVIEFLERQEAKNKELTQQLAAKEKYWDESITKSFKEQSNLEAQVKDLGDLVTVLKGKLKQQKHI